LAACEGPTTPNGWNVKHGVPSLSPFVSYVDNRA
jgi:hypothetical protein